MLEKTEYFLKVVLLLFSLGIYQQVQFHGFIEIWFIKEANIHIDRSQSLLLIFLEIVFFIKSPINCKNIRFCYAPIGCKHKPKLTIQFYYSSSSKCPNS